MRVQPVEHGALQALNAVLQSIESVRNARALYLLMLAFASASLLMTLAQGALARESAVAAALWLAAAFFSLFYASNAAGLVLMDEACGREPRLPAEALRDALRTAHRLLAVVLCVLLAAALLLAVVLGLLWATRLPGVGPSLLGVVVAVGVPALGLAGVALLALVGPLAAPAMWAGLGVRQTLRLLLQQVRRRFAHALMLSAAVSLLTATVAGLVSVVVLAGARALLALAVGVLGIDLAPQPLLAALFGQGLRVAPGAPAMSAATQSALTGAGLVFALGLVVPGVVYLRGLCELFLALRRSDDETPGP
ncbi:MAG: hypothetical protein QE285_07060 [Aquabacterium sp.]|nr:hypothetical protein [Aquabacterium sp.]